MIQVGDSRWLNGVTEAKKNEENIENIEMIGLSHSVLYLNEEWPDIRTTES